MANVGPNTAGSQWFCTFASTPHLDNRHVVFGRLRAGWEVLDAIEATPTHRRDEPVHPIRIVGSGQLDSLPAGTVDASTGRAASAGGRRIRLDEVAALYGKKDAAQGAGSSDFLTPEQTKDLEEAEKRQVTGGGAEDDEKTVEDQEEGKEHLGAGGEHGEDVDDDDNAGFLTEEQKASMTPLRRFHEVVCLAIVMFIVAVFVVGYFWLLLAVCDGLFVATD